jgi:lysozyme
VLPEVFRLFRLRLAPYERGVRQAVKVTISQPEFDALVSLCFNIGPEALARSSVVRHLNAANRQAAADAFRAWNKHRDGAGKLVVSDGLTRRRAEERALFLTGTYASTPVLIYSADASGRLGPVIARMDAAQVLASLERAANGGVSDPVPLARANPAPVVPPSTHPAPPWWQRLLTRFTGKDRP